MTDPFFYAQDLMNPIFDRLQIYDHAGHLKDGKTGLEARGGSVTALADQKTTLPYRQSYQSRLHKTESAHFRLIRKWPYHQSFRD
ncbi:hypothetical protein BH10ACI2_BH10ACI2_00020 [soil metagenome]